MDYLTPLPATRSRKNQEQKLFLNLAIVQICIYRYLRYQLNKHNKEKSDVKRPKFAG